jgi:hypothetical protein
MPNTSGVISELRAITVFEANRSGRRANVLGVHPVSDTDERSPVGPVYRADPGVPEDADLEDGIWRDAGWLVTFDV